MLTISSKYFWCCPSSFVNLDTHLDGALLAEHIEDLFFPFTREMWISLRPGSDPKRGLVGPVHYKRGVWFVPEGALGPMGRRGGGPVSENVKLVDATSTRAMTDPSTYHSLGEGLWKGFYDLAHPDDDGAMDFKGSMQHFAEATVEKMPFSLAFVDGELVAQFSIETVGAAVALGWLMLCDAGYATRRCQHCRENYFVVFDGRQHKRKYCAECGPLVTLSKSNDRAKKWNDSNRGKK